MNKRSSKNVAMHKQGSADETDEMKLKLLAGGNSFDSETLFPAELNQHFVNQIKILTEENNDLRTLVQTKDKEIGELEQTVSSLNQRIRDIVSENGPTISKKSAGIISAKISDLCKQNRHLVAEVESYKTKCSVTERKLLRAESLLQEKENDLGVECKCYRDTPDLDQLDEIDALKQKLAHLTKKYSDSKEKNAMMKNEIQNMNKVFQHEIGKDYTSWKELGETTGWKGRAQHIILLNAKICDLEDKLNIIRPKTTVEEKKIQMLQQQFRDMENKRKRETDEALKEFSLLKEENAEIKKKLEGSRARIRILECDITTLRQKLSSFSDKSSHDDHLVEELRQQLKILELHYQEVLKEKQIEIDKLALEKNEALKELNNTLNKIDAFQKQVFDKANKIEDLRKQLTRFEEGSLQSVFFTPLKSARDLEIKKLSEMIIIINQRLVDERKKADDYMATIRNLRTTKKTLTKEICKLQSLNEILAKKKKTHPTFKEPSYESKVQSTSESRVSVISASRESINMQRKASIRSINFSEIEQPPAITESLEFTLNLQIEQLTHKLEMAAERQKMLEDRIKILHEEKESDYRHFSSMIQTSKDMFSEALSVLHKMKCNCIDICSCDQKYNY